MSKLILFEIDSYELDENFLIAEVFHRGEYKEVKINRLKFEFWLKHSARLEYCMDWSCEGEHQQQVGEYSIDEYWDSSTKQIRKDIYDYLAIKVALSPIDPAVKIISDDYRLKITNDAIIKTFIPNKLSKFLKSLL